METHTTTLIRNDGIADNVGRIMKSTSCTSEYLNLLVIILESRSILISYRTTAGNERTMT